jgi:alpha-galactosidase/6-phospho-beta-glucosidase family protein
MFEFFKKKTESQKQHVEEDNFLASITFFVAKNDSMPCIDIAMQDYSDESIIAMCLLLQAITSDQGYIEAINMLKNGLISDSRDDILIQILTSVEPHINKKVLERAEKSKEPCIKPSDML